MTVHFDLRAPDKRTLMFLNTTNSLVPKEAVSLQLSLTKGESSPRPLHRGYAEINCGNTKSIFNYIVLIHIELSHDA